MSELETYQFEKLLKDVENLQGSVIAFCTIIIILLLFLFVLYFFENSKK